MLGTTPGRPQGNRLLRPLLLTGLCVPWLLASACGDTCVFFKSDQSGAVGGVTVNGTTCPPQVSPQGTVQMHVGRAVVAAPASAPSSAEHIFVTLTRIEARAEGIAGRDKTEWQELAPQLKERAMQIDLLAAAGNSSAVFEAANVPAGLYRELRLRIAHGPREGVMLSAANRCGAESWNCVVFSDGTTRALEIVSGAQQQSAEQDDIELTVAAERMTDGPIIVLPGGKRDFSLEFDANNSLTFRDGNGLHFVPAFRVRVCGDCSDTLPGVQL